MKRLTLIWLCLLGTFTALAQEQESFVLTGKMLDAETQLGVPMVHVIIKNKNKGTYGDPKGKFKVSVELGDQIVVTSIGYENVEFTVTEEYMAYRGEEMMLFMIPKTYELDSLVIFHIGEDFYLRRKKGEPMNIIGLPKPTDTPRDWSKPQVVADGNGVGLYGLLNFFDKDLQQKIKVKKLQAELDKENALKAEYESKYNRVIVKEVTGIDDRVLDEFMEFCNFTKGEIIQLNQYEITARLLSRYHAFLRR